jgi:hypothetical protein
MDSASLLSLESSAGPEPRRYGYGDRNTGPVTDRRSCGGVGGKDGEASESGIATSAGEARVLRVLVEGRALWFFLHILSKARGCARSARYRDVCQWSSESLLVIVVSDETIAAPEDEQSAQHANLNKEMQDIVVREGVGLNLDVFMWFVEQRCP